MPGEAEATGGQDQDEAAQAEGAGPADLPSDALPNAAAAAVGGAVAGTEHAESHGSRTMHGCAAHPPSSPGASGSGWRGSAPGSSGGACCQADVGAAHGAAAPRKSPIDADTAARRLAQLRHFAHRCTMLFGDKSRSSPVSAPSDASFQQLAEFLTGWLGPQLLGDLTDDRDEWERLAALLTAACGIKVSPAQVHSFFPFPQPDRPEVPDFTKIHAAGMYPAAWPMPLEAQSARAAQQAQRALQRQRGGFGTNVVGLHMLHYWELDAAWYPGTIVACHEGKPRVHTLVYVDGQHMTVELADEAFLLYEQLPPVSMGDSGAARGRRHKQEVELGAKGAAEAALLRLPPAERLLRLPPLAQRGGDGPCDGLRFVLAALPRLVPFLRESDGGKPCGDVELDAELLLDWLGGAPAYDWEGGEDVVGFLEKLLHWGAPADATLERCLVVEGSGGAAGAAGAAACRQVSVDLAVLHAAGCFPHAWAAPFSQAGVQGANRQMAAASVAGSPVGVLRAAQKRGRCAAGERQVRRSSSGFCGKLTSAVQEAAQPQRSEPQLERAQQSPQQAQQHQARPQHRQGDLVPLPSPPRPYLTDRVRTLLSCFRRMIPQARQLIPPGSGHWATEEMGKLVEQLLGEAPLFQPAREDTYDYLERLLRWGAPRGANLEGCLIREDSKVCLDVRVLRAAGCCPHLWPVPLTVVGVCTANGLPPLHGAQHTAPPAIVRRPAAVVHPAGSPAARKQPEREASARQGPAAVAEGAGAGAGAAVGSGTGYRCAAWTQDDDDGWWHRHMTSTACAHGHYAMTADAELFRYLTSRHPALPLDEVEVADESSGCRYCFRYRQMAPHALGYFRGAQVGAWVCDSGTQPGDHIALKRQGSTVLVRRIPATELPDASERPASRADAGKRQGPFQHQQRVPELSPPTVRVKAEGRELPGVAAARSPAAAAIGGCSHLPVRSHAPARSHLPAHHDQPGELLELPKLPRSCNSESLRCVLACLRRLIPAAKAAEPPHTGGGSSDDAQAVSALLGEAPAFDPAVQGPYEFVQALLYWGSPPGASLAGCFRTTTISSSCGSQLASVDVAALHAAGCFPHRWQVPLTAAAVHAANQAAAEGPPGALVQEAVLSCLSLHRRRQPLSPAAAGKHSEAAAGPYNTGAAAAAAGRVAGAEAKPSSSRKRGLPGSHTHPLGELEAAGGCGDSGGNKQDERRKAARLSGPAAGDRLPAEPCSGSRKRKQRAPERVHLRQGSGGGQGAAAGAGGSGSDGAQVGAEHASKRRQAEGCEAPQQPQQEGSGLPQQPIQQPPQQQSPPPQLRSPPGDPHHAIACAGELHSSDTSVVAPPSGVAAAAAAGGAAPVPAPAPAVAAAAGAAQAPGRCSTQAAQAAPPTPLASPSQAAAQQAAAPPAAFNASSSGGPPPGCLAARLEQAVQRKIAQALQAFAGADPESSESMLRPLRLLVLASKGGQLLRDLVHSWESHPLEQQQEMFEAALLAAGEGNWACLEERLQLALEAAAV